MTSFIASLASATPVVVGCVFLLAGIAKAIEPQHFVRHVDDLGLLPSRLSWPTATALIVFQCGLGSALMLGVAWPWLVPFSMVLLVMLAAIGYWGEATGRTEDCGCYNGLIRVSAKQSLGLDVAYIAMLALAWSQGLEASSIPPWKIWTIFAVACGSGLLVLGLSLYYWKHGRFLFDLSPLKVGRPWNDRWIGGAAPIPLESGEKIVFFMDTECARCKRWLKVLNSVDSANGLPDVVGVVGVSPTDLARFEAEVPVRFPVVALEAMRRLIRSALPTAVVLQNGVIEERWITDMPPHFVDRVRDSRAAQRQTTP